MSPRADLRPSPPRGPRWAWAAAALWVVVLFTLSSWSPGGGALDFFWRFPHDDKVVHAGLYAVLGALVRWAGGRAAPAVAAGAIVGVADEALQSTVPGRHADPFDVAADVVGATVGALLVTAFARRRRGRAIE